MKALCIASGGSLGEFNASLYYGCYDIVIAVNCAWEAAPWCDAKDRKSTRLNSSHRL